MATGIVNIGGVNHTFAPNGAWISGGVSWGVWPGGEWPGAWGPGTPGNVQHAIIGSWVNVNNDPMGFTFRADGTGTMFLTDNFFPTFRWRFETSANAIFICMLIACTHDCSHVRYTFALSNQNRTLTLTRDGGSPQQFTRTVIG
jgi:hypothetical protein